MMKYVIDLLSRCMFLDGSKEQQATGKGGGTSGAEFVEQLFVVPEQSSRQTVVRLISGEMLKLT
jgi:hypothetical protein